jgi:hypothetical protein
MQVSDRKIIYISVHTLGQVFQICDSGLLTNWIETSSNWLVQDYVNKQRKFYQESGYSVIVGLPYL